MLSLRLANLFLLTNKLGRVRQIEQECLLGEELIQIGIKTIFSGLCAYSSNNLPLTRIAKDFILSLETIKFFNFYWLSMESCFFEEIFSFFGLNF